MSLKDRLAHAWNAFTNKNDDILTYSVGESYSTRPDRVRLQTGNDKTIIASLYNRIAIDVAAISIEHARKDENGRYIETINSGLNWCLTESANIDQTSRQFIQDVTMSLFDEGCVAIVATDTTFNPKLSGSYDVKTMRVGKVIQWYPEYVRIKLYNEKNGQKQDVTLPKQQVAIIENPLYAVMNEPNSTVKRLTHKLNLLDSIDEKNGSAKLDMILQMPYVVKSEARKEQASRRQKELEEQLANSKYGIGYIDATEKITQLNRPVTNNLMDEIKYLTTTLYSQLGISEAVFNGTAAEEEMLNYYSRTVEPVMAAIAEAIKKAFLTKTAISQGQCIMYFRDPFKLVPVNKLADLADKFTRNCILTSNEVRAIMGYKPVDDPDADVLRNKNLNMSDNQLAGQNQNGSNEDQNYEEGEYSDEAQY